MSSEIFSIVNVSTEFNNPSFGRLEGNFKRVRRLSMQRSKNIRYANELNSFRQDIYIEDQDANDSLDKYTNRMFGCCSRAIGQINPADSHNYVALKTGRFCNHRLCNVCNSLRAKKLRRKFFAFFNSDEKNVFVKAKYHDFFPNLDTEKPFLSGKEITSQVDFMHLTLTVPHKNGLWNGKEYYAQELLDRFHTMRKCEWWDKLVYAGEACLETVQTDNNLHIHIHALLLVNKNTFRSRNTLLTDILQKWNELTIDYTVPETTFSPERKQGILKSIPFIKDQFVQDVIISNLDPRGSTLIGLNSLYKEISFEAYNRIKKGKFQKDGKYYKYVNSSNSKDLLKGVLECLKYHFEPCSLEDQDGKLNCPLLLQLLPNIYKKRLYSKFGGFYGLKQLNVAEDPIVQEDIEDFIDNASGECYDPSTGLPIASGDLQYIVFDIKDLVFSADGRHYKIPPNKIVGKMPRGQTGALSAIKWFMEIMTNKRAKANFESSHAYLN